jgi:TM2 domain-containing membrane protein YozV
MGRSIFILFFISFIILHPRNVSANTSDIKTYILIINDTFSKITDTLRFQVQSEMSDSVHQKKIIKKENTKKEKIVSALFAFPFPFGFMGAHRVMLGTKPWVPVVYVATFGGCFGLLPLIDFFVITFSKDMEQYENNPHVFMWVK